MFLPKLKKAVVVRRTLAALGAGIGLAVPIVLAQQQTDKGEAFPQSLVLAARQQSSDSARTRKKEQRRSNPLASSLAELKKTYGLADDEVLKCIQPPFSEARQACFRAYAGGGNEPLPRTGFMIFRWHKDELRVEGANVGFPGSGFNLPDLLTFVAGIYPQEIEGDKELLDKSIRADFVVRDGAPVEKIVTRLETILQKECKEQVKLTLEQVERKVFVARGKYHFTPVAGSDNKRIEIFAKELSDPKVGGGGSGDFTKFVNWLARFVNRRIVVGKVEKAPHLLSWHDNFRSPFTKEEYAEDRDAEAVLKNISAQTSLTFREETKPVRVLRIEGVK